MAITIRGRRRGSFRREPMDAGAETPGGTAEARCRLADVAWFEIGESGRQNRRRRRVRRHLDRPVEGTAVDAPLAVDCAVGAFVGRPDPVESRNVAQKSRAPAVSPSMPLKANSWP